MFARRAADRDPSTADLTSVRAGDICADEGTDQRQPEADVEGTGDVDFHPPGRGEGNGDRDACDRSE